MSRLAKKPIVIPQGVEVKITPQTIEVKGKENALILNLLPYISVAAKDGVIEIKSLADHKQARANSGTMTALLKNALKGVVENFTKILEVEGVGFRANLEGVNLVMTLGFSHPVKYTPPAGVKITVEKGLIKITGPDRQIVGQVAAGIRKLKKPEPYKGTGIRYQGEVIRRKAGKKVASAAGGGAAS